MNIELLRRRMDRFFNKVTPEELMKKFAALGYEFTPIPLLVSTKYLNIWAVPITNPEEASKKDPATCQGLFYL